MDVMPSTSRCNSAVNKQFGSLEIELYYLIVKYLSAGPCKKASQVLRAEIEQNKLLPTRCDWVGKELRKTFEEYDNENAHIGSDHLLRLVSRLGPALNQLLNLPHVAAPTLLGAGSQSLLRTQQDFWKRYKNLSSVVVRQHGYPPLEPVHVCGPPNLTHTLLARELQGNFNKKHIVTNKFYSRIQLFVRSVGHLSAVYCMLFDRSGKYLITGADDTLVKIWSTLDGRLLASLRGASAEISDLAVDSENTLIAAGSCDKIIRVWNLQTLAPIAVLSSHTGMITALQFCPAPDNEGVLVSTGGDGCVAFWTYMRRGCEVKFDSKPLKMNERVRPGNAQLICASFSYGGNFLAVGGADHIVRVYHLGGEDGIERLIEAERHQDRVDSIQWCHKGLMFVSGSRDGTALVWRYETQQWKNIVLNMADRLPGDSPPAEEIRRLQVTMVGWNRTDAYVITASNDKWLRVWDSATGQLKHILKGHEDNSYVIEAHPQEPRLILTAGHDGQLLIWDIFTGTLVRSFKNTIEGQGYGALFDAKWSPDGFSLAATDSHGHLVLYGIGHNEKFKQIPKELFFHTDYRPLIRDANNHVLDEQTQMAPHLMPPPFLVNVDGDPYPPEYQRLVPGRENCRHDQLIPNVILNANGDQEVLDAALHEFESSGPNQPVPESSFRPSIDVMIQRLAHEQDQRIALDRQPSESSDQPGPSSLTDRRESNSARRERRASSGATTTDHSYAVATLHDPLSPRANRVGARRVGDVEGVRQSTGNWQRDPNMKWNRRIIVRPQRLSDLKQSLEARKIMGEYELQVYEEEFHKNPEPVRSPVQPQEDAEKKTRRKQKKQTHSYSTRSVRESNDQNMEDADKSSSSSGGSSGDEVVNEELQESSSSDDQSTDYSDWTAEAGLNLEPPKRTAHKQKKSPRRRKKRRKTSSDEDKDQKDEDDDEDEEGDSRAIEDRINSRATPSIQRQPRGPRPNMSELGIGIGADEIGEEYRPPEWLTETVPKKAPYFPQMGDELIYFMQGHMLYVEAVMNRKLYTVDTRNLPWMRTTNKLRDQEIVKIIGVKYEIKPPRLCCLKLGILEAHSGRLTTDSFTIKYHDMPDVLDFLILKATYDVAVSRHWRPGERFRCIIDDAWWLGTVEAQEPHLPEFPDSMFMCYRVLWDNGERERLSPWDMELIDENMDPVEPGGSVPVKQEELEELLYSPLDEEWAGRDPDLECDRISHGISRIMSFAVAEPFLVPVDLNAYPNYALIIDYPMDLTTIKSRLDNRFYRRINAAQFDVRYIATNTEKFNQKGSNIVRQSRIVTDLCLELIKDGMCVDPTQLYHKLQANYHSPDHSDEENEEELNERGIRGYRKACHSRGHGGRGQAVDKRTWQQMCKDLLKNIFEREDSMAFRYPVDLDRYPDYSQVIDIPMDLTTVREEITASGYATPEDFAKDVQLIFTNSKNYNTNKRSRIYSMTLRLEAYFEDQIKPILAKYKAQGGSSAGISKQGSNVASLTSYGRPVIPPNREDFSLSAGFGGGNPYDEDEDDDDSVSGKDTKRRSSRRVARNKRLYGDDDNDSGEEYNPKAKPKKSVIKNKKKGVATRNRGKVTVQYNEDSEEEEVKPPPPPVVDKVKIVKRAIESDSDSEDESESCNIPGPSAKRTNGQICGPRNRLESSSSEEESGDTCKKSPSNGVNGFAKKLGSVGKTIEKGKEKESDSDSSSSKSDDSSSLSDDDSRGKSSYKKRKRSISDSSDSSSKKGRPPSQKKRGRPPKIDSPKPVPIKRSKDESEVEFDDEDLVSSSEDSIEEEATNKRGRKRGVASNVRRARKMILDGDDLDDVDYIADRDFIDDADLSVDESSSESESESDEDGMPVKKKKVAKPPKKKVVKNSKAKSKAKNKKSVKKKKPPVKKAPAKKAPPKKSPQKSNKKSNTKKSPAKSPAKKKPAASSPKKPAVAKHQMQELISISMPGHAPIPYQPVSLPSRKVIVNEVKHQGRVVGRVITSKYDDNDGNSDDSESESESQSGSDSDSDSAGGFQYRGPPVAPYEAPSVTTYGAPHSAASYGGPSAVPYGSSSNPYGGTSATQYGGTSGALYGAAPVTSYGSQSATPYGGPTATPYGGPSGVPYGGGPSAATYGGPSATQLQCKTVNPVSIKMSYPSGPDYNMMMGNQSQKMPNYSDDEGEAEIDVSSRGRVRKANTLMRDFI